jgi:hypothetical protein
MAEQDLNEVWQVEVRGQIYEAPFGELGSWIEEGSLQPLDKVRKGQLRWIEANRVPTLIPLFEAKQYGLPVPKLEGIGTHVDEPPVPTVIDSAVVSGEPPELLAAEKIKPVEPIRKSVDPNACSVHPDAPSFFVCDGCGNLFCKACPKSYGGAVKLCPDCGELCRPISEVKQSVEKAAARTAAVKRGFGSEDFFNALSHPFNFKVALIVGGLMFAFFSIGRSAAYFGGIYMIVSAIFSAMLANMLSFGVLSNTVENFAAGNLTANFMPSFDDFNLWDDVIHPFFVSLGVWISSFGPFIIFLLVGSYLVMSSVNSHMESVQNDLQKLPGTPYYAPNNTVQQTNEVKKLVGNLNAQAEERIDFENEVAAGNSNVHIDQETRDQEKLWEQVQQGRKAELESVIGKTPETREAENAAFVQGFLKLPGPVVVIGTICFLWGLFYFPIACAIGGYTRSFLAAINPLVGLDTIKRLGGTYLSILLMSLVLLFVSYVFGWLLSMIFKPFDLPGLGNLPAMTLGNLIFFYLWIVFSCILGYAMFKKSDKLRLQG